MTQRQTACGCHCNILSHDRRPTTLLVTMPMDDFISHWVMMTAFLVMYNYKDREELVPKAKYRSCISIFKRADNKMLPKLCAREIVTHAHANALA